MMKDFVKIGCDVLAIGSDSEKEWADKFNKQGIKYKQVYINRNGLNPFNDLKTLIRLISIFKKEKPDKVFLYQIKPIVYGSIAGKIAGIKDIFLLIAGLGSIFRGTGLKNKLIRSIVTIQYRIACKISILTFFQNNDDKNEFVSKHIIDEKKTLIINGSGVNLEKFKPVPLPDKTTFLFIGRLLKDKGIIEYLEACKILKAKYPNIDFLLVGPFDSNPTSIKKIELDVYTKDNIVKYFGEQKDVRPYISQASVFVLPSYHEGTPKTILEAMAMGRPIITTDAPGCRETVNNKNGFLVPTKDIYELAKKMEYFILDKSLSENMGKESYNMATQKYDVKKINKIIIDAMEIE